MTEPRTAAPLRCGDHPHFGKATRDTLLLGCGRELTDEIDALAYRCAQCRTAFCESCIRQHFGWPEAGGGPMPHALDKALAALAASAQPPPTLDVEMRFDWHDSSCAGMETTGLDGEPLTLPCDCGMPEMFRSAYASGRRDAVGEG